MTALTPTVIAQVFQCGNDRAATVAAPLIKSMMAFGITDPAAIVCYLTQVDWESTGLVNMAELGPPAYFDKYNNRADLGNGPTDGYDFRGSGPIQVTGRANFRQAQEALDGLGITGPLGQPIDLTVTPSIYAGNGCVAGPDLARTDRYGFLISAWWWAAHGGNTVALAQPLTLATVMCGRLVNEGDPNSTVPAQGEDGRVAAFNRINALGPFTIETDWDTMTQDEFNNFMNNWAETQHIVNPKWNPGDPAPVLTLTQAIAQTLRETNSNWVRVSQLLQLALKDKA